MGLLSFIKDAGERLFGKGDAKAAQDAASADPSPDKIAAANDAAAKSIVDYIRAMNLDAEGLDVTFDAADSSATVAGVAADQETKEKILLCCGNVAGVGKVNDLLTVAAPAEEARYYTVVSGDTLSKIAKSHYGNANAYMKIFEANKPMLTHPDKIYPGQMLRIPPAA
ncbi:MAG: peptidoglycan-binding protein LysM [Lautropia sp.]